MKTTDLCDAFEDRVQVSEPVWEDFGGVVEFGGPARTLRLFEDNTLVRAELESPGEGRVLVVDGGGSRRCALLGGNLAALAEKNGWAGIIVNGCVRDRLEIAACQVGVKALASHPKRSRKLDGGEAGVDVRVAGCQVHEGDHVYADEDGVIVSPEALSL